MVDVSQHSSAIMQIAMAVSGSVIGRRGGRTTKDTSRGEITMTKMSTDNFPRQVTGRTIVTGTTTSSYGARTIIIHSDLMMIVLNEHFSLAPKDEL